MALARMTIPRAFGLRNVPQSASLYCLGFQRRALSATASALRASGNPLISLFLFIFRRANIIYSIGPVPKFNPTSSPELDALLEKLRNEKFMPSYLSQLHYRLVHRKSNHTQLLNDPITVEIEGEPFKLVPGAGEHGTPGKKFVEALNLMKEPSDFDVIPELIRGCHDMSTGARQLGRAKTEKMARLLGRAGRTDILMQIARDAKRLFFRFTAPLAGIFMRGLRQKQKQALEERGAMAVLAQTRILLNLIGKREICVDKKNRLNEDNEILGTVLSMFAEFSLKYGNGKDHEGSVEEFTLKLKSVWTGPKAVILKSLGDDTDLIKLRRYVHIAKNLVIAWEPVLEGLLQAKSILAGSELSPWLEETSEELAGNIADWGEFVETNTSVGWAHNAEKLAEQPAGES